MVIRSHEVLQEMLQAEQARLEHKLGHSELWANEHMGYGNHMADDATEAFEQAKDLAVRKGLSRMLVDVREALGKFALGTYGICERCEIKIDWARLEAKPEAHLCIRCQQRSDFVR